jgi:8-oxo-dGTP pyrophosphatase MutT (NUDIX family)
MAVPSGHVDVDDESFAFAAARETKEETSLRVDGMLTAIATDDIVGDSCRRGADAHRWHSFKVVFDTAIGPEDLKLNYELEEPEWLTFDEALETELSYPVRYEIELHNGELEGP